MLKVKVFVNNECIDEVNFWNVSKNYGVGKQTYQVFNGKMSKLFKLEHNFHDGYWRLLSKALPKLKTKPMSKKYRDNLDFLGVLYGKKVFSLKKK